MRVRWAKQAQADREAIFRFLYKEAGIRVALATDERFVSTISLVEANPQAGKIAGQKTDQRKIAVSRLPFIVIYVLEPEGIAILRILHTSRRIAENYQK